MPSPLRGLYSDIPGSCTNTAVSFSNNSPKGVLLNVSKVCEALCVVGSLGSHEGFEMAKMVHMGVHDTLEGGTHFVQLCIILGLCCSHFCLCL